MKTFQLFIAILFAISINYTFAQDYNFYNYLHDVAFQDTSYEDGEADGSNSIQRLANFWGPRLYPHGDASIASKAFIALGIDSLNRAICQGSTSVLWESLGPVSNPIPHGGVMSTIGNGRMNCIYFDPQYNRNTNKNVYSISCRGGLWKSSDCGLHWSNANTDLLPICSVSDIAIDFNNSNNLFICTGNQDEQITTHYLSNMYRLNPIFTVGVFRSIDGAQSWQNASGNILSFFPNGGTMRKIIINPTNNNELFCATTSGVFKTTNSLSSYPTWTLCNSGLDPLDNEWYGLTFKQNSNSTLYLSGKNIYSSSNSGATWTSITGASVGLDIPNLLVGGFTVERINLTTTPANPDLLFAYIEGISNNNTHYQFIYKYSSMSNSWTQLFSNSNQKPWYDKTAIAVSPVDENTIFYGTIRVYGTRNSSNPQSYAVESPNGGGCHSDIHGLTFEPNVSNPKLFAATDGGVSIKDVSVVGTGGWNYACDGLNVSTIWSMGVNQNQSNKYIIALQDCGVQISNNTSGQPVDWWIISEGDGYEANPLDFSNDIYCYKKSDGLGDYFKRYNFKTDTKNDETQGVPLDHYYGSTAFVGNDFPSSIDISNGKIYMGFSEIYERTSPDAFPGPNPGNLYIQQSDVGRTLFNNWERQMKQFKICPSDPNIVYILYFSDFDLSFPTSPDFHAPKLFKSTNGLLNGDFSRPNPLFQDISNNLPKTNYNGILYTPVITSLTVSPKNSQKIWITFSGFDPIYKVWTSDDGGNSWHNDDLNGSLANIPVNSIVYQEGTNDRLYIGTDAGVYYKDQNMACWMKYGNLPNVVVTKVDINYCNGKIVAGTYGRGIWQANVLPSEGFSSEMKINSNTIWSSEHTLQSNIHISSGATLSIYSKVYMPSGGSIIIDPGSKLIIDGGTITNECGSFWEGIKVGGNKYFNQYPPNAPLYQALVKIVNGGTIENARNGISTMLNSNFNTTGGVIIAENANFINNRRSIEFLKYDNFISNPNKPTANLSHFTNCHFIVNDDFHSNVADFYAHMSLWGVHGVKISGCTFENSRSNPYYSTNSNWGIYSIDATYNIEGLCSSTPPVGQTCPPSDLTMSSFSGFSTAIEVGNSGTFNPVYISDATFSGNVSAIKLRHSNYSNISSNHFLCSNVIPNNLPANIPITGISTYQSSNYGIYFNELNNSGNSHLSIGLDIRNSGGDNNIIDWNSISNFKRGFRSVGTNRNIADPTLGLEYVCNDNNMNNYDMYVTGSQNQGQGIRLYQEANSPAYNSLSQTNTQLFNNTNVFLYYYNFTNLNKIPQHYTQNTIALTYTANSDICTSLHDEHTGVNPITSPEVYSTLKLKRDSIENEFKLLKIDLYTLIDNGNTDSLIQAYHNFYSDDEINLRSELLNQSPYVSRDVIMNILKNDLLPNTILFDVMYANPDLCRDDDLMRQLESSEFSSHLSIGMINILRSRINKESTRTDIEASLATYQRELASYNNKLVTLALTYSDFGVDSLITVLSGNSSLENTIKLNELKATPDSILLAKEILQNYLNQESSTITEYEHLEVQDYLTYLNILISTFESSRNIAELSVSDQGLLADITSHNTRVSEIAKSILCYFYNHCIEDEIINDDENSRKSFTNTLQSESIKNEIFISPNPTNGRILLSWILNSDAVSFKIENILGNTLMDGKLSKQIGSEEIDLGSIANGVYLLKVFTSENQVSSCKFAKQ